MYDSKFRGSTSIKQVLPAVVPEMSYEKMDIADGLTASAIFAYMAKDRHNKSDIEKIRKNLLEYCKLDTLAMVRLQERLSM